MARKTTTKKTTSVALKSANNKKVQKTVTSTIKPKIDAPQLVEETVDRTSAGGRSVKIHRSTVFIVLGILLLGFILYYGRGFFVAAVVNGQPVSRLSLVEESERESGKQAMTMLVRNVLVEQEAKKQNVKVSDKDVADQIKTIDKNLSKQGQNLDDMLKLEGMSKDDLHRIVRLDLLVGKLVGKEIKITDKDVDDYIEKNKDILPKDQKGDALKKAVRERIKQEQLPEKAQAWFANIEKQASIIKFVNY
jgi:foldase protein PrsA